MTSAEFLDIFKELIQTDIDITLTTPLSEIEEWDSMAMMALTAHFDAKYGLQIPFEQLANCETPKDIAIMAPDFTE